jgi:hypothetical protein
MPASSCFFSCKHLQAPGNTVTLSPPLIPPPLAPLLPCRPPPEASPSLLPALPTRSDPTVTLVGYSWDGADQAKLAATYGFGRERFGSFHDLQQASCGFFVEAGASLEGWGFP